MSIKNDREDLFERFTCEVQTMIKFQTAFQLRSKMIDKMDQNVLCSYLKKVILR